MVGLFRGVGMGLEVIAMCCWWRPQRVLCGFNGRCWPFGQLMGLVGLLEVTALRVLFVWGFCMPTLQMFGARFTECRFYVGVIFFIWGSPIGLQGKGVVLDISARVACY